MTSGLHLCPTTTTNTNMKKEEEGEKIKLTLTPIFRLPGISVSRNNNNNFLHVTPTIVCFLHSRGVKKSVYIVGTVVCVVEVSGVGS